MSYNLDAKNCIAFFAKNWCDRIHALGGSSKIKSIPLRYVAIAFGINEIRVSYKSVDASAKYLCLTLSSPPGKPGG